jgi:predicted oxidoreductase
MKTYKVPNTDIIISRIAFGVAMLGTPWDSDDFIPTAIPAIRAAQECGITFFDLADVYGRGRAEEALGEVLRQSPGLRDEIVIQTKCGERFAEGMVDNSREHLMRTVEGSLKRLGTDRIDLLLLHFPDTLAEPYEIAAAFDELHQSGKVRAFGVSNFTALQVDLLKKAMRQPLVANQIQLGLGHWAVPQELTMKARFMHGAAGVALLDYCWLNDIQVQAYSPLKCGSIMDPPNLLNPASDASPDVRKAVDVLAEIAARHGVTPAAVMLAWLLRHPAGIVPIVGGNKPQRMVENSAADRVELTRAEWYQLLAAAVPLQPGARRI